MRVRVLEHGGPSECPNDCTVAKKIITTKASGEGHQMNGGVGGIYERCVVLFRLEFETLIVQVSGFLCQNLPG